MNKQAILICVDGLGGHYLEDPKVRIPNIRSLMNKGAYVTRLKTTFPSVTWTANTSAVTGCHPNKHGVIGNSVFDFEKGKTSHHWGDQLGSKEDLIHVSTLYDQVAVHGGNIASICWPVTRGATNIHFNIPEHYDQSLFEEYASPSFWNELQAFLPVERYAEWSADFSKGHMQDWLTKEITKYVIQHKETNLIMAHFLLIDSLLHKHGNKSPEVYWAIEYIDQLIGDILACLRVEDKIDDVDILLYSDHGHVDVHSNFYSNRFLKEHELNAEYKAVSNDGCLYIYALNETHSNIEKVASIFESLSLVKDVIPKHSFGKLGLPTNQLNDRKHTPELIVELEDGYLSKDDIEVKATIGPSTYQSTHGYSPDHPLLKGFMVGAGPSFKKGKLIDEAHIVDIAPTMAQLLDIQLPAFDGKVLNQLLHPACMEERGYSTWKTMNLV
ncbi:alkaline phosphatase family protein [Pseudalkalibacillus berkeleyi]|uniref:Ectonucleotide pyrophosphatase/phosphodiesterase n=1 Tax=Pseudalkalibacillus berkeleyi TaxID=1069813 RepID=A0ABS9GY77_9BACL|nr:ectonucleotide pyrophosphatase/phosphodiesterase [Pseudalkalibacillus berkeleyi]MCF6136626.1 ectonucleotide pyrophosphatase/phosphodiesterase [Pseudalkalibacillus berkeleyi]